jgi:hypothetical protein
VRRLKAGTVRAKTARRLAADHTASEAPFKEYRIALPPDYPARGIELRLGVPRIARKPKLTFSDHAVDSAGRATDTVLATTRGGFCISHDLGRSWRHVPILGLATEAVLHLKWLGESEVLVQVSPMGTEGAKIGPIDTLVVNESGQVLAEHKGLGYRWHGCRAVDLANGTLMFAEYPRNDRIGGKRRHITRVFRSRDRGRTWSIAFEQPGDNIQHFHFVQARPGVPGEWWLTSGDAMHESRVWVSRDDGDTWADLTAASPDMVSVDGVKYPRTIYRLTDLAWEGDDIVWGTDDKLAEASNGQGSGVFRSAIGPALNPRLVGRCYWHMRNLVDVGHSYIALSQGCPTPSGKYEHENPGVYLVPKRPPPAGPGVVHLFDIETPPGASTTFTASRASRAAKDGKFFSHRSIGDAFSSHHRIMEWDVRFT